MLTLSGIFEKKLILVIMKSIVRKVFTYLILPLAIVGLTWATVKSVMEPVEFNKYKA